MGRSQWNGKEPMEWEGANGMDPRGSQGNTTGKKEGTLQARRSQRNRNRPERESKEGGQGNVGERRPGKGYLDPRRGRQETKERLPGPKKWARGDQGKATYLDLRARGDRGTQRRGCLENKEDRGKARGDQGKATWTHEEALSCR